MSVNPLVSVIVPVHNAGDWLVVALRSVLGNRSVGEVLVVDDGSTDDGVNRAMVAVSDERIVWLSPGRIGLAAARQLALTRRPTLRDG